MTADEGRLRLLVTADGGPDLDDRLAAFEAVARKRRGLRLERRGTTVVAWLDLARIEQLGPLVEAAAMASNLRVTIADLDAELRSAGLERGPSRLWAAVGNAADELEIARTKGEEPTGHLFRYVRVEDVDGVRTALDDRPPWVDPTGIAPTDVGPTKYDDLDYHVGPAEEAGQPIEHAFTHIGLYLAWLIRNHLHDPRGFPPEHIEAVKRGEMTGSDLADDIDSKLLSDSMSAEGAAFSDARYRTYLGECAALFSEEPDYGVADDEAAYATVGPLLDRLYAEWIAAGRPAPEPEAPSPLEAQFAGMIEAAPIPWDELVYDGRGIYAVEVGVDGTYEITRPEPPHADSALEALVSADLLDAPIEMSSSIGTHHGALFSRAFKQLGVRPRDVTIAHGLAREGEDVFGFTLYRVPGASAEALSTAFAAAIFRPRGSKWEIRRVGDIDVWWAEGYADPDRTIYFNIAYWTRDDLVLHVFGRPVDMETAIRRLG